ncbi:MAG: 1-(5-phosphoribosyl)-5-[(5-phosphoribosylamino)methylideneamino]imidazole-4-carboxamide isomerase [Bacteroidetes bacterium]|nr:1-(5-phosphoribosyl)-5-[(5-phosphoribosylamino)methylideneamino]imidazole-4-carboxamide isomerase [Bacteroidota bacterium]
MLILPAIDIYNGACVRLRQGNYEFQKVYSNSPVEVAKNFLDAGFSFLHIVDLEGAKEKKIVNWSTIEALGKIQGLSLEVGGGIRTKEDIERLFSLGVKRVILGSIAVHSPRLIQEWIEEFTAERIVISVDVKNNLVAIHGWQEKSGLTAEQFIQQMIHLGARIFICTDIARDGMLKGPNNELYRHLKFIFPSIDIIASGGITTIRDIEMLVSTQVSGVIVGKALYEERISLQELLQFNQGVKQC